MCGIAGAFAYGAAAPAVSESELLDVREAMAARGPDGAGLWLTPDRRCGLAHRRLAIIDPTDRAAQPMLSADGRLAITYNGEIYNFPELKAELVARGAGFRTTSDTEMLLHLYALEGEGMVGRLRGMFALGIWDSERAGLFLARDPYGIKPLYVADDGRTLRFASQVKALVAGAAPGTPDAAAAVGFHLFGYVPEPFTLHGHVRALPAGTTQWIDGRGARKPRPYVALPAVLADGARRPAASAQFGVRVRAAVADSVRAHLLADVPVGVFLSAGVDSGAMLALMREASVADLTAVTLAFREFEGTREDEAPLAAEVATRYGARHVVRRVDRREFEADLPEIVAAMDQPSIDGVNTWFVAKAAREAGLKVAISGLGGDELLAGYPSFVDLPRWRRRFGPWAAVPGVGPVSRAMLRAFAPSVLRQTPKAAGMLEHAGSWTGAYLLRRGLFLPHELPALLGEEVAREGLARLGEAAGLAAALEPDPGSDVGRVCALESCCYLRGQLLRDADWAGMAHGVEIRTPLVDIELLRALAPFIPALRPGAGKAALASGPATPLPDVVVRRAKTGFTVPTSDWMDQSLGRGAGQPAKGLTSRRWARQVFAWATGGAPPAEGLATAA
ncbi:MAG TPA: asparagine synthase (glutamine-hydrolyzing) [Caulobacteraceae bacterium]|nr:asparagine synthase (glutamine-hydrolyzing) [Caulobacteraceae bacterium]